MRTSKAYQKIADLKNRLAESIRICVREELLENFGHVSARDPESGRIFVLRHLHERLDRVTAKDFIEVDESGRTVTGKVEPPKEVFLHTAIYRKRKDANAVVYSHPLYSTILGVLGKEVVPLLANCTFIKSGIRIFEVPRYIGSTDVADLMIKELDSVVLTKNLTEHGLRAGDVGCAVMIHGEGDGYEVEFVALTGETMAVVTVPAMAVRPVRAKEIAHARRVA